MEKRLLWVFLFVFVDVLGFSIVLPLFPYFSKEFGVSASTIGLVMTSNALSQMISAPLLGRLSDRYGRRPLLLICLLGTFIGFVVLANAHTSLDLFLSRIIDGLLGGNISLAQAYISDITNDRERTKGFAVIGAAFGLAFIFGPAIGGTLSVYGFRAPAILAAFLSLLNLIGVWSWLPESLPQWPQKQIVEMSSENGDMSLAPNEKKVKNDSLASIPKEILSRSSSINQGSLLTVLYRCIRFPILLSLLGVRLVYGLSFTLFESSFGFVCTEMAGLDSRTASYLLAYFGIVFSLAQLGSVRTISAKIGEGRLLVVAMAVFALSLAAWASSQGIQQLALVIFPLAASSGLVNMLVHSEITRYSPKMDIGSVLGLCSAIGSFSRVVSPLFSGYMIDLYGPSYPGKTSAALMLVASCFAYSAHIHRLSSCDNNK